MKYEGHTPGPWGVFQLAEDKEAYGLSAGKWIVTANEDDTEICGVVDKLPDARLLADAPALLAQRDALLALLKLMIDAQATAGDQAAIKIVEAANAHNS
jgi:hypothetical protein